LDNAKRQYPYPLKFQLMLLSLRVKNFLLLKEAYLEFSNGFNVLTGETGAGKSLLLKALSLALGDRVDWEVFSDQKSIIELEMLIPDEYVKIFENYGIEIENNILNLRRIIEGDKKKSRIYANDNLVLSKTINEILRNLIEIHGQYETYKLFDESYQMEILDRYAKSRVFESDYQTKIIDKYANNEDLLEEYRNVYKHWIEIRNLYSEFQEKKERYEQELDFLKYQLNEIESANLRIGEEEELIKKLDYLKKIEQIKEVKMLIDELIFSSEDSVLSKLSLILRKSQNLNEIDEFKEISNKIENVIYEIKELKEILRNFEFEDYENINIIQERLFFLNKLKKKYGKSIEELINYKEELKDKIKKMENLPFEIENLAREVYETENYLNKLADEISKRRKNASKKFRSEMIKYLKELGMPDSEFIINFEEIPIGYNGKDKIEFLFSSNKEFPAKPLKKVASGGELSRLALALKLIIAGKESPSTLIFDEIDTGIGGQIALKVAQKLKELSKFYQIIVITHLPQIASFAQKHFLITKKDSITDIREIKDNERIVEIARMLSGIVSEESLEHAKTLLFNSYAL
jgi:DNA repair protein RecN (Recombination protein N)